MREQYKGENLVTLKTEYSPTSIKIRKEAYRTIYPSRNPKELHVVFPPKTRMLRVDQALADYLTRTYPFVTVYELQEAKVDEELGDTNEEKPANKGATGKGRRPPRKL